MRFRAWLMVWALTMVWSCSKPPPKDPAERYLGKWKLDVEASLEADEEVRTLPLASRKNVGQVVGSFLDAVTLDFKPDGRFTISNGQTSTAMAYEVQELKGIRGLVIRLADPSLQVNDPRQVLQINYLPEGMRMLRGGQVFVLERASN